ncbi:MAG TPA: pectinesterase family protein [Humisphaera sp.]|jgi:pectinesterase|nr:pectinesterase family protein [Humisphaera sp.]
MELTSAIVIAVIGCASVVCAQPKAFTVAADGSGVFKTIQSAINAVPDGNGERVILRIKAGIYKEKIVVPRGKTFISFVGDDARSTILTNDWNTHHIGAGGREVGTMRSASVRIDASDFLAQNITFENSAGDNGQAVALAATGDRQIFRNCRLIGWQDTLYANGGRQYYDRCHIEGRVDFIFGSATAVFDHCEIHSKNGGHITAASTAKETPWGYVFLDCKLTSDAIPWRDAAAAQPAGRVTPMADLGRPWRPCASVTFVRCELGDHIKPQGWSQWRPADGTDKTARYAEYACTGPGADLAKRVPWAKELTAEQASELTVEKILGGSDAWTAK